MDEQIIDFIKTLRDCGVRISVSESIDACKILKIIDIFDKEQFKYALKTSLIKNVDDIESFERIFNLYFQFKENQMEKLSDEQFENLMNNLKNDFENDEFEEIGDKKSINFNTNISIENEYKNFNKDIQNKQLLKNGTESDIKDLAKQIADSQDFDDFNIENISSVENLTESIMSINNIGIAKSMAKNEVKKSCQNDIDKNYDKIKKFLKEELEKSMVEHFGKEIISNLMEQDDIMELDFSKLNDEQLEKVEEIIKKMAKKISAYKNRREKSAKKGKISFKKTIRSSISNGNFASELKFKNKKIQKPKIVIFCDISGSVYIYVSFLLQILFAIEKVFSKVESIVFVSSIKNVTEIVKNSENMREALKQIELNAKIGSYSNYKCALEEFNKEDLFDNKTVVIIMGDARNNGNDSGKYILKDIKNKSRCVYWLNPVEKNKWYNGDSVLDEYEPYCDEIFECSNLKYLEKFINKLIKI